MTKSQKSDFENELNNNDILKTEVEFGKEVNEAIKEELLVADFRSKMQNIHTQSISKPKGKLLNIQNKWYWAAASLTLATGTAYFSVEKHTAQPENLFNEYYEVWQPALITRSTNNSLNKQIFNNFETGNYIKTIALINELPEKQQNDPKIILTKGCALMESASYIEAIEEFNKFDTKNYTLYTESGNWYKALCYIKLNQNNKALNLLNTIASTDGLHSNSAKNIIDQLK